MPPQLNIEHIKALLISSPLISSWQIMIADETARRALYKIRCQLLRSAYRLEIRLIQTEDELLYSYQLFTNRPLLRWDNAPHFPAIQSFPHHQHQESEEVAESFLSGDPSLDLPYILDQIRTCLTQP